jgi:hypothetical protein
MKPYLMASLLVRVSDPEAEQIEKTVMGLEVLASLISEVLTTMHPSGIKCDFPT